MSNDRMCQMRIWKGVGQKLDIRVQCYYQHRHAILTYDSSDKMSSKVYRYTIQLDSNGGCAWSPSPTVSFDESPTVVTLNPHQAIRDQIKMVRTKYPTAGLQERLELLNDLFMHLINSPEFFISDLGFTAEINRVCWNLLHDVNAKPINERTRMVYFMSLSFM